MEQSRVLKSSVVDVIFATLQWNQMDHMQRIYTSLQTTTSLNFCRLDALPDA